MPEELNKNSNSRCWKKKIIAPCFCQDSSDGRLSGDKSLSLLEIKLSSFKVSTTMKFALRTCLFSTLIFQVSIRKVLETCSREVLVTKGNMLDVGHLDIDPRDIMVFIYQSRRRLVESGSKIAFERATSLSEPFGTLSFCD